MAVSDWGGTHSTVDAIKNGLNVEMPSKKFFGQALLDSVKAGVVPEEIINQRVREVLRVRLAVKAVPKEEANIIMTSQPAQQKVAYEVACKSIVLLKNDGILPLKLDKKPVIAVIGANATMEMANGGLGAGVKTLYEITPLQGLKNRIGDKAEIIYAQAYEPVVFSWADFFRKKTDDDIKKEAAEKEIKAKKLELEAIEIATKADIVIFVGGNTRTIESEGSDRKDIFLPSGQEMLISMISEVNPNIITILTSGAPNDLNVVNPLSKALLISWFNGTEGGNALADVLLGNISPSGRLPFTLPMKLEDSPSFALGNINSGKTDSDIFANLLKDQTNKQNDKNTTENKSVSDHPLAVYSEESLVGYRWYDTKNIQVMYPFGFGLTYTTFEYNRLKTDKKSYSNNDVIKLSFELKNTGHIASEEVVQIYIHRINPSVEWPNKELKAFSRIPLLPGENKTVELDIPVKDLQYWDEKLQRWNDDLCNIELLVGSSVNDIKLKKTLKVK